MKRYTAFLIQIYVLLLVLTIPGCSFFKPAPRIFFSQDQSTKLLNSIQEEDLRTETLVSSGIIELQEPGNTLQANFLFVGKKDPLNIKIEITHSWGKPLLHCLLYGNKFKAVNYIKKLVYEDSLKGAGKALFLSGAGSARQVWSIFRGYPEITSHESFHMPKPASIVLYDSNGKEVEIIEFDLKTLLPKTVLYPDLNLVIHYSGFSVLGGNRYAKKIEIQKSSSEQKAILTIRKIFFNKPIASEVFKLLIPPGYKKITVD